MQTVWCPSCGAEYRADTTTCPDCRVALVPDPPVELDDEDGGLVEIGEWPRVQAQVLRRRLETAGVSVMIEWSGPAGDATGILLVPEDQAEFGTAVVNEIDVDDEVADNSPHAMSKASRNTCRPRPDSWRSYEPSSTISKGKVGSR